MGTSLKGLNIFGDSTVTNHVRENLISFFDYGLIEKSGFVNIEIPSTGYYGGLEHQLRPVRDPRYSYGQVWEAFRSNWVWESGLGALTSTNNSYPGVSGVYVDDLFYPISTTGNYSHYINYPLGRVIFDNPIDTDSTVTCEYSYKYVNVTKVDGLEWFKQIQQYSERSENTNFVNNSGEWGILADNRLQLPAIGIELINSRKLTPHALGGGQHIYTDFLFHCVAEDLYTRDHLVDIISLQNDRVLKTYDLDKISDNNNFPLDYRGMPISGALRYPDLVSNYEGNHIRLIEASIDSVYSFTPNIHIGTVKLKTEVIIFGV
jgi:hypothetical protein